jgi:Uncharacterised nucleotidyltransferase
MDWAAVDSLVDRAQTAEGLAYHRLGVFAARRLRAQGRPVPEAFEQEERLAALAAMTAGPALERVVAAAGQPLLVLKGPVLASRYPEDAPRPYRDLDLLAVDATATHRALVGAGAEPARDDPTRPGLHHEAPLVFPGLPMVLEIHRAPKWPDWASPPAAGDLFRLGRPYDGDDRLLVLPEGEHAVLVAAHSWAHRPLRRILDLIDVAVLAGPDDGAAAARRWGLERLWRTTAAAAAALLDGAAPPWPLRTWARDLPAVRERTEAEAALERRLAPLAARPPIAVLRARMRRR